MFVKSLPGYILRNERILKRYPLRVCTSFDNLKDNISKLSYRTVGKYYKLPLNQSGINSRDRLNKNPSIVEMLKTIQNEWNIKQFREIEIKGDKIMIQNNDFDSELFYKQYKRLIDCLYYFDHSYVESVEEYERAHCLTDDLTPMTFLSVCPLDGGF